MLTCSWSGSTAPGANLNSDVIRPVLASNIRTLTSQPGKRVFFHSISDGRTRCECWSTSITAFGVMASMALLLFRLRGANYNDSRFWARACGFLCPALADRRLESEPGVPGKIDPGVLRNLGDER